MKQKVDMDVYVYDACKAWKCVGIDAGLYRHELVRINRELARKISYRC